MRKSIQTGVSGIAAEILFASFFIAIGLLITWICWMVSL
jgi:hypothetical protein